MCSTTSKLTCIHIIVAEELAMCVQQVVFSLQKNKRHFYSSVPLCIRVM